MSDLETQNTNTMENASLLILSTGKVGQSKKINVADMLKHEAPDEEYQEGDDPLTVASQRKVKKERLSGSKKIYVCRELDNLKAHDRTVRDYVEARCLPMSSFFKDGSWLLSSALLVETYEYLEQSEVTREGLIDAFMAVRDTVIERDRNDLGPHFNPLDYLSEEETRERFKFSYRIIAISVPTTLASISTKIMSRELAKAQEETKHMREYIETFLATELEEVLSHLLEKLTPHPDGTPKRFIQSDMDRTREFWNLLGDRNVTQSTIIGDIAARATTILNKTPDRMLKANSFVQNMLKERFTEMKTAVSEILSEEAPTRRIRGKRQETPQEQENAA